MKNTVDMNQQIRCPRTIIPPIPPLSAKNPHIFSLGEQKAFAFRALTRARALFMDQGFQI